jgi:hypothetical protein
MLPFDEKELSDLKSKLAAIATGMMQPASDWRQTKIKGWHGMAAEAERMDGAPRWWANPRENRLSDINQLLESRGMAKLQTRDDKNSENVHVGERVLASEVAEHQHNQEKTPAEDEGKFLQYMPRRHDNLAQWYANLGVRVDINKESRSPWFSALGSYIAKFPATATLDDVDAGTIAKFLEQICEGAHA